MKSVRHFYSVLLFSLLLFGCKSTESLEQPASPAGPTPMASAPAVVAATSAEGLVEAYIEATGGMENIRKMNTVTMKGQVSMMGMDMPLLIYSKRPAMMRSEVEVTAMNVKVISGYDGKTAWMLNPMIGTEPQLLPAEQAASVSDQAQIDGLLVGYKERGYTVTYVGEEPVRGKPARKLKVDRPERSPVFVFLDAASHLQVKQEGEGVDPQTGATVMTATYMLDYRSVQGVMLPHRMEVEMGGTLSQTITMSQIDVNTDVNDQLFAVPISAN